MTDRLAAAIGRLTARRAAGVNIGSEELRAGRKRHDSHWLRAPRADKRGRRRARLGRVARFDEE